MSDKDAMGTAAGGMGTPAGASAFQAGFYVPTISTYDFVVTDEVTDSYNDGELYDYRIPLERGSLTVRDGEALEDVASRYLAGQAARTRRKTDHIEMIVYPVGDGHRARNEQVGYGGYGNTRTEWREPPPLYRIGVKQATAATAAGLDFPQQQTRPQEPGMAGTGLARLEFPAAPGPAAQAPGQSGLPRRTGSSPVPGPRPGLR